MQIEQHQKCAHASCRCQVSADTEYCSDHCRDHEHEVGESCGCGHADCSPSPAAGV